MCTRSNSSHRTVVAFGGTRRRRDTGSDIRKAALEEGPFCASCLTECVPRFDPGAADARSRQPGSALPKRDPAHRPQGMGSLRPETSPFEPVFHAPTKCSPAWLSRPPTLLRTVRGRTRMVAFGLLAVPLPLAEVGSRALRCSGRLRMRLKRRAGTEARRRTRRSRGERGANERLLVFALRTPLLFRERRGEPALSDVLASQIGPPVS